MAISLRATMDASRLTRLQWSVAVMLTGMLVLEGMDFQIVAYSGPALMALWGLGKLAFAPLLAAAMIGMAVGTLIGSWTGDRFGRRPTLLASVAFFGVMTMVCANADSPRTFMLYRFISGLGFGAAFPVATALMGEWMPRRVAGKAISIMTIGVPVGVILGAVVASNFLPVFGWRMFFVSVGAACVLFAGLLALTVPESPSYLVLRERHERVHVLLRRIFYQPVGNGVEPFYLDRATESGEGLFDANNARLNVGLWIGYLGSGLATYTVAAWLTVILTGFGFPLATALRGQITYSSSAIVGAIVVGWLIARLGSRFAMLMIAAIGAASALAVATAARMLVTGPTLMTILFLGLAVTGFCIGALIPANLVLATRGYPTDVRSRGVGIMTAIARVGSIFSSFIGGAVLVLGTGAGFFIMIAVLIITTGVGAMIVNRHIARTGQP